MKYLNKNFLLICIAILLVGGSFIYAEYSNKEKDNVYNAKDLAVVNSDESEPQDIDTDGDGSRDWEEILVGTDPNDAKSKPSDKKSVVTGDISKTNTNTKLDPMDIVSREFFARYMELRQLGSSKDKASQLEIAQATAGNIVLSKPATYTEKEILIKQDQSIEAVRQYGLEVGNIFKKYLVKSRNEGVIVRDSIEQEDPEILKELDPVIASNKNIINSLVKLSVPASLTTIHLDLLNAMNGSLFVAQSFKDSGVSPVEGIQAIQYYTVVQKNLFDAVNALKSYLKYLGINENIF